MAMQARHWISNPLPNEQNADAQADAKARKRGFCECGSRVGCSLERPTAQVEKYSVFISFLITLFLYLELYNHLWYVNIRTNEQVANEWDGNPNVKLLTANLLP